jgi:hypothetical protein
LLNNRPLSLAVVLSSSTVISMSACPLAGISMPVAVSSITREAALPVLIRLQAPPASTLAPTKRISAAERPRSSRILTSYRGAATGVAGTVMR